MLLVNFENMVAIKLASFFSHCFIIIVLLSEVLAQDCMKNNEQFQCKFGVVTPYRYIANVDETPFQYPNCSAKKIWLMIRHGTRYPGKKNIRDMTKRLPEIQEKISKSFNAKQSKLNKNLVERITAWKQDFNKSNIMHLTTEGEREHIDLAERMQARFPKLFPENYDRNYYKFKFTATQRTELSAKSFALGLFGQHQSKSVFFPEPEHKDPILRFYKRCERWQIEVDDNIETYKEKELFIQSKIVQNVILEISKQVGFTLDWDSVYLIYKICGFETAWGKDSPWCDLLSFNDVKILEYVEDLKYYWVDGYGHHLTYEQACPALLDMFSFFDSPDQPRVTTYFTHSGSILKMLSILGIAKDEQPLTHKLYDFYKDTRKWRTGLIDAFASNLAFVLYDCKSSGPSVLFLHQERPTRIPGCPDTELCPLSIMKNKFPHTQNECQFDTMCSVKKP